MAKYNHHHHHSILIAAVVAVLLLSNYTAGHPINPINHQEEMKKLEEEAIRVLPAAATAAVRAAAAAVRDPDTTSLLILLHLLGKDSDQSTYFIDHPVMSEANWRTYVAAHGNTRTSRILGRLKSYHASLWMISSSEEGSYSA